MTDTATRIGVAHDELTAKLTELRRRETAVRTQLSPLRYLASPWLYVGIAAFVGYRLGRPSPRAEVSVPAQDETIAHAVVRASVIAVAQALVRHAVVALVEER